MRSVVVTAAVLAACTAAAAVKTWVAPGGGRWSDAKNWSDRSVPRNGDSLVFPVKAGRGVFENDLADLTVADVTLSGGARQIHKGRRLTVKGALRIGCARGAEIAWPIVWSGDGELSAVGTNSVVSSPLSGAGTIRVRTEALLFSGDNRAFAGEIRVENGCARFTTPACARPGEGQPAATGGEKARLVVDARRSPTARISLEPFWANPRRRNVEQKHYAAFHLIQGDRAPDRPWLETSAGAPLTLWGRVTSEGRGRHGGLVLARHHLAFASAVVCTGGDLRFTLSPAAYEAGKTIAFTGCGSAFARALVAERAHVILGAPISAPGGVRVEKGTLRARLHPAAPGGVFFENASPVFTRTCLQAAPDGTAYTLETWNGEKLAEGVWPAAGRLKLAPVPKGYYRLRLANGNSATFAVVPDTRTRRVNPQSWYAASGLTSVGRFGSEFDCPWSGAATDEFLLDLGARAGIGWTRTWLWLGDEIRDDGSFDGAGTLATVRAARARGIHTTLCVQTHSRRSKGGSDLAEIYRNLKAVGEAFGGDVRIWEYLNECDSHGVPGWRVAAQLKAASLGLRAACPKALLSPPAEHAMFLQRYDETLYGSDIAKYIDYMNYHLYNPLALLPHKVSTYRHRGAPFGFGAMMCFATEAGTHMEGHGKARFEGRWNHFSSQDAVQEICTAEYVVKLMALCRMNGVRRTFPFTFRPKNEQGGKKDWSWAMRRDGTVRPGFAAFSTMIEKLDTGVLEGMLGVDHKSIGVRAYAYRMKDGTQTLTFWSESEIDAALFGHGVYAGPDPMKRTFSIRVVPGEYRLTDMCGRARARVRSAADGMLTLTATRFPQYLEGVPNVLGRYVRTTEKVLLTAPIAPGRVGRPTPDADEDLSIVIYPAYDPDAFAFEKGFGDSAQLRQEQGRVWFVCWNLSDKPKRGALRVLTGTAAGGADTPLELPPMGCVRVAGTVRRSDFPPDGAMHLSVDGMFNGKRATKAAIALSVPPKGDK